MITTITVTVSPASGSYVARIVGQDDWAAFELEFLDPNRVDYRELLPKGKWREEYNLRPGLYEVQEFGGARRYGCVDEHGWREISKDDAKVMAERGGVA